jgi:hypothetical protein
LPKELVGVITIATSLTITFIITIFIIIVIHCQHLYQRGHPSNTWINPHNHPVPGDHGHPIL